MKDFALDENGDILIEEHDISLVRNEEQEIQKICQVLGTKLGEWKYDKHEGIDFEALSQKYVDLQRIRETIQNALHEINENYLLQDCNYEIENHVIKIQVSAEKQSSLEVYVPVNTND